MARVHLVKTKEYNELMKAIATLIINLTDAVAGRGPASVIGGKILVSIMMMVRRSLDDRTSFSVFTTILG